MARCFRSSCASAWKTSRWAARSRCWRVGGCAVLQCSNECPAGLYLRRTVSNVRRNCRARDQKRLCATGYSQASGPPARNCGYNILSRKLGEVLHIGMRPLRNYAGDLTILAVGNGGSGLPLVGSSGDPDIHVPATKPSSLRSPNVGGGGRVTDGEAFAVSQTK